MSSGPSWKIARIWSTATTLSALPLEPGTTRIIISVAGIASVRIGDALVSLRPGQMILLGSDSNITVEHGGLWARCEWHLRSAALRQDRFTTYLATVLSILSADYMLLTTMTNVISTNPSSGTAHGAGVLLDAFAATVMAAVLNATGGTTVLSSAQTSLVQSVIAMIDEQHHDPSFTIARLVRTTSVSKTHLHRLFAKVGTTPRRMLEARRVATATILLNAISTRNEDVMESIASQSGFPSARTMHAAIQRQQGIDDPGRRGRPSPRPR
jgi:AraC-like DNA-binding protein